MSGERPSGKKASAEELIDKVEWLDVLEHHAGIGLWDVVPFDGDPMHPRSRLTLSSEFRRLMGFSNEAEFPNVMQAWSNRLHADDVGPTIAALRASLATGNCYDVTYRLKAKDDSYRWFRATGGVIKDETGIARRICGSLVDIHAFKQAEEDRAKLQEHLERAQSLGSIGSCEMDLSNGARRWSREYFRLLGLDHDTTKPGVEAFTNAVLAEDRPKLSTLEELWAHEGPIAPIEIRVLHSGGKVRWLQRHAEVTRNTDGRPAHLVFTLQDITKRKHLEAALVANADKLRSSREHLARAQRAGQIGSWECNLRTGDVYCSEEIYRLFGIDPEVPLTYEAYLAAVHPEDRAKVVERSKERAQTDLTIEPATLRIVRPDGEVRWIYRVAEFTYDGHGAPISVIATLTDVTELRRAQQEQARLQEQLAHAQRLESLGALSGGIAHDFNNLLTTILGNAALLLEDESLSLDAQHLAQAVICASKQGAELTRRLLSFGRRQILSPIAVDLQAVAGDLDTLLRRTLGEDIQLLIQPDPDVWTVHADKSQLEAAIINLAVNARDAMSEGGLLTIDMANHVFDDAYVSAHGGAMRGDYVAISVSDTGTGMTPDVLAHAFEPFFTTKQEGRGTGLGLAMVYGFAKQSGGYATIYSEPGVGTRVAIFLPRSTEKADTAGAASERRQKTVGGTERILLIEDDAMVREYLVTALERLGYQVTAMPDAHVALPYLDDDAVKIDLLLTDLMLPGGMNGNHLAAEAAKKRPGLRVLFASGYTQDALIRQGRLEPGQRLIAKPFASGELAAKVREALDG